MKSRFFLTPILLLGTLATARADDPPAELAWVPTTTTGFIHIRVRDLWDSAAGKNVVKAATATEPKLLDQLEQTLGVQLSLIDRVTILLPDLDHNARQPGFVVRVTTTRAYNRDDVKATLKVRPREPNVERRSAGNLFPLSGQGMIHLDDDKNYTLLPNEEGAIALLGRMLSQRQNGSQAAALAAAAGPSHIVASLDLTQVPRIPPDALPQELRTLRPLIDAKSIIVSAKLGEEMADLELRFTFGGKDDAAEAKQALDDGMKAVDEFLATGEKELGKQPKENAFQLTLIKEIRNGLKTAKVTQQESAVAVTVQARSAETLSHLIVGGTEALRVGSYRATSVNNLKQIALAMHNYESAYGKLPAAAICDKNGKPLLSWRVAILPFIEENDLYKQFRLDEPWDSTHNIALIKHMPKIYMLPGDRAKHEMPSTHYQVFVGNGAIFDIKTSTSLAQIPDGTSNTLLAVEAADAVPWTKPDDIAYDPAKMPKIGFFWNGACNVAFADGSVRTIRKKLDEKTWHLIIQRSDGNPVPPLDD